jgi:sortase A
VGSLLLSAGVLLVAFVAFQLWGTALYTNHAQSNLRKEVLPQIGRSSLPLGDLGSARPGTKPKSTGLPAVATSVAPTTAPPPVGRPIGLLAIPKLGLDDVVVEGTAAPQLQGGPGHYLGTALPGQAGNAAIAGHRTTFAAPFYDLNELVVGDPIFVLTSQGLFRYDVTGSEIVSPTDEAVLDSVTTTPQLTLTTCNPRYSASQRLVVFALLDTTKSPSKPATGVTDPKITKVPKAVAPASTIASSGTTGNVLPAVLWGLLFIIGAFGLRFGARRLRRPIGLISYLIGVPVLLLVLFVCFQHVSLALPPSY